MSNAHSHENTGLSLVTVCRDTHVFILCEGASLLLAPFLLAIKQISPAVRDRFFAILSKIMQMHTFLLAALAGILPSFIWLWFWTREDSEHSEPRWLLAAAFIGGIVAVAFAIVLEKFISDLVIDPSWLYTWWAAAEEILKFIVLAMIIGSSYNDEPIKPMVYAIVIALGFAALENTLFIMGPLSRGMIAQGFITGNMRFIGATLVHIVGTALIGFSLGIAYYRCAITKACSIVLGLAAAIALHAAFNLSIISASSSDTLKTFFWVWGAVVILIILFEEVKAVRPKIA